MPLHVTLCSVRIILCHMIVMCMSHAWHVHYTSHTQAIKLHHCTKHNEQKIALYVCVHIHTIPTSISDLFVQQRQDQHNNKHNKNVWGGGGGGGRGEN